MPVGAAIGAAGALGGAAIQAGAAKSAAKTQAAAANRAADLQLQMFNTTREDLDPYRSYGASAVSPLSQLLGLSGDNTPIMDGDAYVRANQDVMNEYNRLNTSDEGRAYLASVGVNNAGDFGKLHYQQFGANEGRTMNMVDPRQAALEATPGYQFARDQGILSVNRSLGSRGLTGAQAKGIARFVTGLADTTYGNQVDRLANAVTTGQNAAAQTGQFATQTGQNAGNALTAAGTASAAGTVGAANAIAGGLDNAAQYYLANKVLGMYGKAGG